MTAFGSAVEHLGATGFSVTYRREGRVLVADNPMRTDFSPEELNFLVQAWRAVFAKAQSLGWLY
jgi:hypothetical protein